MKLEIELPCAEGTARLEVSDEGEINFYDWDEDVDHAMVELGFDPSPCYRVWDMLVNKEISLNRIMTQILCPDIGAVYSDTISDKEEFREGLIDAGFIDTLLVLGADSDHKVGYWDEVPIIAIAAKEGYLDAVDTLITWGANVNAANGEAILCASRKGNTKIVELLIDNGASVNIMNGSPLDIAVLMGHSETVELLLERGANPMMRDQQALRSAVGKKSIGPKYRTIYEMVLGRIKELEAEGFTKTDFPEREDSF